MVTRFNYCFFCLGVLLAFQIPVAYSDSAEPPTTNETPSPPELERIGQMRFYLGGGKPKFDTKSLQYYEDIYGQTGIHPDIGINYYPLRAGFLSFGGGLRFSYYRDSGKALKSASGGGYVADENQSIELKLIPIKALFLANISNVAGKWLDFTLWAGYEELTIEEVRNRSSDSTSDSSSYVNRGRSSGSVFGGAINLCLNIFDERQVKSLHVIGLDAVYLSLYYEIAKIQKSNSAKFARNTMGLLFTFESMH